MAGRVDGGAEVWVLGRGRLFISDSYDGDCGGAQAASRGTCLLSNLRTDTSIQHPGPEHSKVLCTVFVSGTDVCTYAIIHIHTYIPMYITACIYRWDRPLSHSQIRAFLLPSVVVAER